jgi:hypothetical protein
MAKKPAKTAQQAETVKGRVRLSRSAREHIRRLKAAGRVEEAHAFLRAALDSRRGAARN